MALSPTTFPSQLAKKLELLLTLRLRIGSSAELRVHPQFFRDDDGNPFAKMSASCAPNLSKVGAQVSS
jgi:hypothetical protein